MAIYICTNEILGVGCLIFDYSILMSNCNAMFSLLYVFLSNDWNLECLAKKFP